MDAKRERRQTAKRRTKKSGEKKGKDEQRGLQAKHQNMAESAAGERCRRD